MSSGGSAAIAEILTTATSPPPAGRQHPAVARVVLEEGEAGRARRLLYEKYSRRFEGSLERWRDSALPVAVDLREGP